MPQFSPHRLRGNFRLHYVRLIQSIFVSAVCFILVAAPLATAQTVGNGLLSNESTTVTTGSTSTDTLWADGNFQRWRMSNYSASTIQLVAAWPCNGPGCIPYAGAMQTPTPGNFVYPETGLSIPGSNPTNQFLQVIGGFPAWVPSPIFGIPGSLAGQFSLAGVTGGSVIVKALSSAATGTASLPNNTGTVAELNLAQTWGAAQTMGSTAPFNFAAATTAN